MRSGDIIMGHSHDDDEALQEVRDEIKRMGLTQDDVRIRRVNGQIIVQAKRDRDDQ